MSRAEVQSKNFLNKWLPLLVAFFAPIIILIIIYVFRGIFPFGDQMFLRSDMYHQYAPFFKQFQEVLKSGADLTYNWNIGLGTDFSSTWAYYLASPLNWFSLLLPTTIVPEIMNSLIILRAGLMSLFFAYYLSKKFDSTNLFCAAFGIFYALSSYLAAYAWNVMWLDCLVLFPLIILGLERLVKEGKCFLYIITVGISVFSNYYISIMIAIFLIFYFIYLLICEGKVFGKSNILKKIGTFVVSSFVGGMIGAISFLPSLCNILGTASADSGFPKTFQCYYSFIEFASKALLKQEVTMLNGYVPNIYCTVLAFALIPLFFICKKIDIKEKIGKLILLVILVISFTFNIPAFIWHGFHFPNSLRARHSFIYIFLILLICYEVCIKIKEFSYLSIAICFALAIGAAVGLYFLNKDKPILMNVLLLSITFMAAYGIILMLIKGVPLFRVVFTAFFCALCIVEAYVNIEDTGFSTTRRSSYMNNNEADSRLLKQEDTSTFYRTEKIKRRSKNDGAWDGYKSASVFSSTTPSALTDFYKKFGMQGRTNAYSFYGHTPLMAEILDVKYLISNELLNDRLINEVDATDTKPEQLAEIEVLYEYNFDMSLGYLVNENFEKQFDMSSNNPFMLQNGLIKAMVGAEPIYEHGDHIYGNGFEVEVTKDGREFFYIEAKLDDLCVEIFRDDSRYRTKNFSNLENALVIDVGDVKEGDIIKLSSEDESYENFSVIPATMDYEKFEEAINTLNAKMMDVTEYKGNYVKANVNVGKERTKLFTSIPYSKGWSVYVDGKKTNISAFEETFIVVPMSEGKHVIEFKYHSPGLLPGIILSLIAILALIINMIYCKIQKFE